MKNKKRTGVVVREYRYLLRDAGHTRTYPWGSRGLLEQARAMRDKAQRLHHEAMLQVQLQDARRGAHAVEGVQGQLVGRGVGACQEEQALGEQRHVGENVILQALMQLVVGPRLEQQQEE